MRTEKNRAEAALRAALRDVELVVVPPELDPGAVRRRLRRRRTSVVVALLALVVAVGAVVLPRAWPPDLVAGTPSASRTAPPGWRIEQYRDVSVFVPDSWGYASAPAYDWCAASPSGQPLPEQSKPYVSLGVPNDLAPPRQADLTQPCPEQPESLLSEHLELNAPSTGMSDSPSPTAERQGDWWVLERIFHPDLDPTVLKVVSRDRDLAERIVESAAVGGPCAATSPVQENQPNPGPVDLAAFADADRAVVCQYEPGLSRRPEPSDGLRVGPQRGGPMSITGLQAARVLPASQARSMVAALREASRQAPAAPSCPEDDIRPRMTIEVRLFTADRQGSVFLTAGNCTVYGGNFADLSAVDTGSAVFPWTRRVCDAVVVLPVVDPSRPGPWACSR